MWRRRSDTRAGYDQHSGNEQTGHSRARTLYANAHVPLHKAFKVHAYLGEYGRYDLKGMAKDVGINYKTALRLADVMI